MNLRIIFSYVGKILRLEALFMLPVMIFSLFTDPRQVTLAFLIPIVALVAVGQLMMQLHPKNRQIYTREGFAIVALSWIFISLFGALPYFLSGAVPNFVDAFFETVSGFTTTGASILTDVDAMPKSLLCWRSLTIWLGGMGVLVFFLAFAAGEKTKGKDGGSYHIVQAESPGPTVGKLVPKMGRSAGILYLIYAGLTVVMLIMLLLGGMPFFDSFNMALSTTGTGGFAVRSAGVVGYSRYLQTVIAVFMALSGINFNIYYLLILGQVSKALRNEELRCYLGIMAGAVGLIAFNIFPLFGNIWDTLHNSFFQVASVMTTTGFATADFALWPAFSRTVLLLLMIFGGSAGSTSGGAKIARLLILGKSLGGGLQKIYYPRSVKVTRMDGKVLEDSVLRDVNTYMIAYFLLAVGSVLVISLGGYTLETTISAMLACLNNIGPGLDAAGPMSNFAFFSPLSKVVLIADMLIGRLEIFPILLLFSPQVWRRGR